MKLCDIQPRFLNLQRFNYRVGDRRYTRITSKKTQYSYRFMYVDAGRLSIELCGVVHKLRAGDLVYILPGDEYRLEPVGKDFRLINLFFDLGVGEVGRGRSCVFIDGFRPELCVPHEEVIDAEILNRSRIFDASATSGLVREIGEADGADGGFRMLMTARLCDVIYRLLSEAVSGGSAAKKILDYINEHPTGDLSAEALEMRFRYHRNHINRLLKTYCGRTLTECIRRARIGYAMVAAGEDGRPLSEIAAELGYYDYSHFYKAFEREVGISPGEYLGEG